MLSLHQERLQNNNGDDQAFKSQISLKNQADTAIATSTWVASSHSFTPVTAGTISSDGAGFLQIYASQGAYTLYRSAGDPPQLARAIYLDPPSVPFGYPDVSPNQRTGMVVTDDTADIQQAINILSAQNFTTYGGTGGTVYLSARVYNVTNIMIPEDVSLCGVDPSVTFLAQIPTAVGPVITSLPFMGSSTSQATRQVISRLAVFGGMAGIKRTTADINLDSFILGANQDDGAQIGYYAEGVGIPWDTTVAETSNTTSILSTKAKATLRENSILFRKACQITLGAAHPTLAKTYRYTIKFTDYLDALSLGMLVKGPGSFGDDVAIQSLFTTGGINYVTFWAAPYDGGTVTSGTAVVCHVSNAGIFIADPKWYSPNYDPSKIYPAPIIEQVQIFRCGGDGVRCCPRRPNLIIRKGAKVDFCFGRGVSATLADNIQILNKVGMGNNWRSAIYLSDCGQPKIIATDSWLTVVNDKDYDIELRRCRSATIESGDLNGRLLIVGTSRSTHIARVSGYNFKFKAQNLIPSTLSADAYLVAKSCTVIMDSPYFIPDTSEGANLARPDYIWKLTDNALICIDNMHLTTLAPTGLAYKILPSLIEQNCNICGWFADIDHETWNMYGDYDVIASSIVLGEVGEVIDLITPTAGVELSANSAVAQKVLELSLPPGNWAITVVGHFSINVTGTQGIDYIQLGVSTAATVMPGDPALHSKRQIVRNSFNGTISLAPEESRIGSPTSSTTIYLVAIAIMGAIGSIKASIHAVRTS